LNVLLVRALLVLALVLVPLVLASRALVPPVLGVLERHTSFLQDKRLRLRTATKGWLRSEIQTLPASDLSRY
jgi:hypothetical protein